MEHHTTTSRAEAERLLGIAEKLLRGKDFGGCRDFAILAQETEPLLEGSDQILAVAEVFVAADNKRLTNNQPDWYSILQIPQRSDDTDLIAEASAASIDEAYFSGICAGLSFRSLLAGGTFEPATGTRDPLRTSKIEPLFTNNERTAGEAPQYNFFSKATSSSPRHQLPGLRSFELPQNTAAVDSPVPNLRFEADSYGNPRRKRRQPYRLSDKTRYLRKLLPGDEKMDMVTVLEEAYKYIKFLQAQVGVLRLMPCQSSAAVGGSAASIVGTDLGRLNRQQLLQVVTNSPAAQAQAQICAEGCCVYSAKQVVLLEKIAEREALI